MFSDVYDFDGTIYRGDSSVDFFLFIIKKRPAVLRFLPRQIWALAMYKRGRLPKKAFKEAFFCFLQGVPNVDSEVNKFWKQNCGKLKTWYITQKSSDDTIISASPEFLLWPICKQIGISRLIATIMDPKTGAIEGENCYGIEKARRWKSEYPGLQMRRFYSDTISDLPLAQLSKESYLVHGDDLQEWLV